MDTSRLKALPLFESVSDEDLEKIGPFVSEVSFVLSAAITPAVTDAAMSRSSAPGAYTSKSCARFTLPAGRFT